MYVIVRHLYGGAELMRVSRETPKCYYGQYVGNPTIKDRRVEKTMVYGYGKLHTEEEGELALAKIKLISAETNNEARTLRARIAELEKERDSKIKELMDAL